MDQAHGAREGKKCTIHSRELVIVHVVQLDLHTPLRLLGLLWIIQSTAFGIGSRCSALFNLHWINKQTLS